jgi:ribonuclease E
VVFGAADQPAEPTTTSGRAPRRSRSRAAAPATTPSHEEEVASLDVVASIEALAAEPAAPARRSRRATSAAPKTTAPVLFEDAEVTRPRRAATRRAAAPAPVEAEAAEASAPVEAPVAAAATTAPATTAPEAGSAAEAPRKTRSRRSRSAEPVETPAAPVAERAAAPEQVQADEAPAEEAQAPRRTTALLFQAPDPEAARPRRRRAQTPAGPPKAVSEAAAAAADEVLEDEDAESTEDVLALDASLDALIPATEDEGTDASEDDSDDTEDEDDNGQPRRRRRRGGRGRRNRGGSDSRDEDSRDSRGASQDDESSEDSDDEDDEDEGSDEPRGRSENGRSRSRRRGRGAAPAQDADTQDDDSESSSDEETDSDEHDDSDDSASSRRRRRRRRGSRGSDSESAPAAASSGRSAGASSSSRSGRTGSDEVTALKGSTRLEAKRQRRREGRDAGRRRSIITEAEFLARREAVERSMIVRERNGRTQIAVLEDGVLVEHYVSQQSQASMAGNVYLGRVQNVLPSMEAAFVDVGKGRNAVLYAGEVNWDAHGLEGAPRRIEQALKSGDSVLVQVTKDPIGQKGARLTSQVTLAGRYLVYVPGGGMTGISRKLPDTERARLKKILREVVPETAGVIVRTAAEGASEEELRADIARLQGQWEAIEKKSKTASAPALLQGEPDLAIRVVRDIFNDDFTSLTISGDGAWSEISEYVNALAPDLAGRVKRWTSEKDVFAEARIDEQLAKGMDRKVWLPSGGSLVIDRTEAMTVVDVNTGKFTGSGGTLEETVTRNNLEAAEEIVRQLRLRDIGGIIVVDFIDMVLESNRDLVLRRMVECLGRDRTKHQVAEVTSLGLVQMTRKRVGQGLVEAFSETCDHCNGRGFIVHDEPNEKHFQGGSQPSGAQVAAQAAASAPADGDSKRARRKRGAKETETVPAVPVLPEAREAVKATLATIAAAAAHAHEHDDEHTDGAEHGADEHGAGVEQGVVVTVDVETAEVVDVRQPGTESVTEAPSESVEQPGAAEVQEPRRPVLDVVAELRSVRRPVSGQGRGEQTDQQ